MSVGFVYLAGILYRSAMRERKRTKAASTTSTTVERATKASRVRGIPDVPRTWDGKLEESAKPSKSAPWAPAMDLEAERLYSLALDLYQMEVPLVDIASRLRVGVEVIEEFEVVGIPAVGLPPMIERERTRIRAAMMATDPEVERRAAAARTEEELAAVRVEAARQEADRVRAALDAGTKSKEDEARLAKANRTTALALAQVSGNLLRGSVALSKTVGDAMAEGKVELKEAVRLLSMIATVTKTTAETARIAVQLERLVAGEPTAVVGHVGLGQVENITPEDAEKWLRAAQRAFERRGHRATVIDVGEVQTHDGGSFRLEDARRGVIDSRR